MRLKPKKQLKRQKAETLGKKGEFIASIFLRLKFYFILEKNYKTPFGEIDLIIKRGNVIAFVEVKTRNNKIHIGNALLAVNKNRISRAANHYLMNNAGIVKNDLRFDVIFLAPKSFPLHLMGAFENVE
jgi:putative endonuclease